MFSGGRATTEVFRSGSTREAALEIAGVSLPLLLALVNKSFVRQRVGQRFSQHPLLLEFAREKAQGRPREFAGTEDRHSRYFLAMLSTLEEALVGSGQLGALELLDAELANLRRAWSWEVAQADGNLLRKAAKPLGDYYSMRGRFREGLELFSEAVLALEASPLSFDREPSCLLVNQAHFFHKLGDYSHVRDAATRSLALGQAQAQTLEEAHALEMLGKVERTKGNLTESRGYFEQVLYLEARILLGYAHLLLDEADFTVPAR